MVFSYAQEVLRDGVYKDLCSSVLSTTTSSSPPSIMSSSLKTLCKSFLTASQILLLSSSKQALGGSPPTCSNPQTSCQNTTAVQDTCCFNSPGGQLLQTQFWDVSPAVGPTDSWTIHGLWYVPTFRERTLHLTDHRPDHCDGTYDATCDPNRQYTNITAILTAAGQTSLLSYMNTYWKPNAGTDESFWEHEWGKHGTCISTLEPNCYTSYAPQEEVVDFFTQTVSLFQSLPSYTWLSNAGIVPSSTATYTSAAILAALETPRGVTAVIRCANTNQLDEIWYFYDVSGSVQTGTFVPVNPST